MTSAALTLADVVEQVHRVGGDPATTTFRTWAGPVSADDHLVGRELGAVVLDFTGDFEQYDDGDDLRMQLVAVTQELSLATRVVDAASHWAATGAAGGFDHLRASLRLLSALEDFGHAQASVITGEPAPREQADAEVVAGEHV